MGVPHSLQAEKASLRKELRARLAQMSSEKRMKRSQKVLEQLFRHSKFRSAQCLLCYVALPTEVETRPVFQEAWREGKRVYAPSVDQVRKRIWMVELKAFEELESGAFGVREPSFDKGKVGDPEAVELVVVPGLGFDREGRRLGRGEGYFDRFLKTAKKAYKIGLAFECQIREEIPSSKQDVRVDEVLIG